MLPTGIEYDLYDPYLRISTYDLFYMHGMYVESTLVPSHDHRHTRNCTRNFLCQYIHCVSIYILCQYIQKFLVSVYTSSNTTLCSIRTGLPSSISGTLKMKKMRTLRTPHRLLMWMIGVYVCVYVYVYVCAWMYEYMYVCVCVCTFVCMYVFTRVCMYVCMHDLYVCMSACMYVISMYVCLHA